MSKRKDSAGRGGRPTGEARTDVKAVVRELLATRESVATGEIAAIVGLSRQAVHYHFRGMVASGELRVVGSGRGAHYRLDADFLRAYPLADLAEDRVWQEVRDSTRGLASLPGNVLSICRYAVTEIVNNAIDHSDAERTSVSAWDRGPSVSFRVVDEGIGAFRSVRERLGLEDELAALQEISKGKTTTKPEAHTGEGIFVVSKSVDVFTLEANGLRWTVDNLRADQAAGGVPEVPGTRVWWQLAKDSPRDLREVFGAFTDQELRFTRSKTVLRLFVEGASFVSRSEAKRLAHGLERFEEVIIDFSGIDEVGQGFVDELFRVWASEHPNVTLIPANMVRPVRMMLERGLPPRV